MSNEALAVLRDANSLAQTLTFEQLQTYHVPFDELTGTSTVESQLEYWATRRGRVALVGQSGTGKSSVMSSVLGALSESIPDDLVPVRVPVALVDAQAVTEVGAFGRHLIRHVIHSAAPEALSSDERDDLDRQIADLERRTGRRRRGGFSLGTGQMLPVDARLSGDLSGAATDLETRLGHGDVVSALERLVTLFRGRGLEPFLVFDDTDAWLQLPGQEEEARSRATGFLSANIRMLSREVDCGFALAVHHSYLDLPAYQALADSLEHIELPRLDDPVQGIVSIIRRRIEVDELAIAVDDAFSVDALDALAVIYSDVPDLRRVIAISALATRKAFDDDDATIVTREAVNLARAERETFRGSG